MPVPRKKGKNKTKQSKRFQRGCLGQDEFHQRFGKPPRAGGSNCPKACQQERFVIVSFPSQDLANSRTEEEGESGGSGKGQGDSELGKRALLGATSRRIQPQVRPAARPKTDDEIFAFLNTPGAPSSSPARPTAAGRSTATRGVVTSSVSGGGRGKAAAALSIKASAAAPRKPTHAGYDGGAPPVGAPRTPQGATKTLTVPREETAKAPEKSQSEHKTDSDESRREDMNDLASKKQPGPIREDTSDQVASQGTMVADSSVSLTVGGASSSGDISTQGSSNSIETTEEVKTGKSFDGDKKKKGEGATTTDAKQETSSAQDTREENMDRSGSEQERTITENDPKSDDHGNSNEDNTQECNESQSAEETSIADVEEGSGEAEGIGETEQEQKQEEVKIEDPEYNQSSNKDLEEQVEVLINESARLKMENKLMRSEVRALNDEVSSLTERITAEHEALERANDALHVLQMEVLDKDRQLMRLRKQEDEFDSVLAKKDAQHTTLQVKLEEGTLLSCSPYFAIGY